MPLAFGFKVTDAVAVKKFPNLPRFGAKAGQVNRDFLNTNLFATAFLKPCEAIREKVGILMFEFSKFWPSDYEHGRDLVAALYKFLAQFDDLIHHELPSACGDRKSVV